MAVKASAARSVSGATFSIDSFIGALPPVDGRKLYMARVDPHLIFGCEVIIDVNSAALRELESAQQTFIRRLLGLSARSLLYPLFTETGLMPIKYRKIILALGYLVYLLQLPPNHLALAALRDSLDLAWDDKHSWARDPVRVCYHLPNQVRVDIADIDNSAADLPAAVAQSAKQSLQRSWEESRKLVFRSGRHDVMKRCVQPYLKVHDPRHRVAITKFLLSDHSLAVEQLRRTAHNCDPVERAQRRCRFCLHAVEDEVHALLACRGDPRLMKTKMIPRPAGTAGASFNIQIAMGLAGTEKRGAIYKALVRHVHDLTMNARLNWELPWAKIPPKEKATLFDVCRARHPFLARFVDDWATEELVKQFIKNKRNYAYQKGYLDRPSGYEHLKANALKRSNAPRRKKAADVLSAAKAAASRRKGKQPALENEEGEEDESQEDVGGGKEGESSESDDD